MHQEDEKTIKEDTQSEEAEEKQESQSVSEVENDHSDTNQTPETTAPSEEESEDLQLSEVIEQLQEENKQLEDKTLRLQAEISNIQRRNTIDRNNAAKYRSQTLASELLDVLDNLERALSTDVQSEDGKTLKQGIEMVHKQFLTAFEKEKITVINPENEAFDPNLHQAVSMMPAEEEVESNMVINVLQKGYKLDDRVIRPAMVIVAE